MAYFKYGIATRIDASGNNLDNFHLNLFSKKGDSYFINEKILNDNFWNFRKEFLSYTVYGDSISDSDAYVLETSVDKLVNSKVKLSSDYYKYSYSGYDFIFDTDFYMESTSDSFVKISFIPIFWDTNRVEMKYSLSFIELLNNLTKKCLINPLKDTSSFYIV